MRVILASNNSNKVLELKNMLINANINLEVFSLLDVGITDDIIEDGHSFHQNSLIKAQEIANKFPNDIVISDDSGLVCDGLNGEPGIYSARYAGGADLCDFLLNKLKEVDNRDAHFKCVLTCIVPNSEPIFVSGEVHGVILDLKLGTNGFGYDPVFSSDGHTSFAQLTLEQKSKLSHRHIAFENLLKLDFWKQYV